MIKVSEFKRIVIKLGSSVVLEETGELNTECLKSLVTEMVEIHKTKEVIIVSSGAIGIGKTILGIKEPRDLAEKQMLASVGQAHLIQIYENLFSKFDVKVGQVLLTREDLQDRCRYLNARNTLLRLLEYKIIPVINENDAVVTEEIKFGDNDTLSALIASKMDADLLIILSDVEGIYKDSKKHDVGVINEVSDIISIQSFVNSQEKSKFGVGGIGTKIEAAKIVMAIGITMVLTKGDQAGILGKITGELCGKKETGTWFVSERKMSSRKRWIAFNAEVKGSITIDDGAVKAIREGGKSLLPSGIKKVEGNFESGDVIQILDATGSEIARGIANYSAEEARKIAGRKTGEITTILGHKDYDEVVHRDNLVNVNGVRWNR